MHFAQTSVALDLSWLTAHLYEDKIFRGAIAVTQACCEPVLQSTTATHLRQRQGCVAKDRSLYAWLSLNRCRSSVPGRTVAL